MSERPSSKTKTTAVVSLSLKPRAGFCVKTATLEGASLPVPHAKPGAPTPIPAGLKVFVNMAWDVNAPPSPQGSEEAIERVLRGEEDVIEEESMGGLYIPAIVSPPREDRDKAGNPSLVFDCIYNTTVKARISGNEEYKAFIVELALQRIEGQTGLVLSRDIRTPNIASKGRLLPRTVQIPASLLLETPTASQSSGSANPASKEQEASNQITSSRMSGASEADEDIPVEEGGHEAFSQAILEMLKALPATEQTPRERVPSPTPSPRWSWRREDTGRLCIEVEIPGLTAELSRNSTLDVEPRRLLLCVPHMASLDIDLALPDADIKEYWSGRSTSAGLAGESDHDLVTSNIRNALNLKRERDLDVDGAEAEWKVGSGVVVIRV